MHLKPILAIIVLYKMPLTESPTYQAMERSRLENGTPFESIGLVIADNSPEPCALPPHFEGTYIHDGENPGLAVRYNQALALAGERGADWLLLFDQDTRPTAGYFEELIDLATRLSVDPQVDAIVPKLQMDGRIMSPHEPRYRKPVLQIDESTTGILDGLLRAFNSGALVRVSSLKEIGGFPTAYSLDFLDHATFHRLQMRGGKLFVMRTMLEHELSVSNPNPPIDLVRLTNRLVAEERFHTECGSWSDRLRHRIDLTRQVIGHGRRGRFYHAYLRLRVLLHLG